MKTKKKKITPYQKAIERMNRETNRAISHVENLSKLYNEMVREKVAAKK
jgi:hypothetical protein